MPVFEYRCSCCGRVFERFWRGPERREELRCPACGTPQVVKRLSMFGTTGGSSGYGSFGAGDCAPSG